MLRKMVGAATLAGLVLAGCSQKTEKPPEAPKEKGHFTITPPKMPTDPVELKTAQKDMVESMIADTSLPLDMIEGEAYRRSVTLTPEQIARKKAQTLTKTPPMANHAGADADATSVPPGSAAPNAGAPTAPGGPPAK